jgi:glucose/arabinose dehydrogenase
VPVGFCAHAYANVIATRQLRFSPGGDLFVASPSTGFAGGAAKQNSFGQIAVLPDDDNDGVADNVITFLPNAAAGQPTIASTQGLMFAGGYFYFQDGLNGTSQDPLGIYIRRVPFNPHDRAPSGMVQAVATITAPQAGDHWPKMLDIAKDGTIYVTNASDQGETCWSKASPSYVPYFGAIFKLNPNGTTSPVARGFRNPIALRCEKDHDVCLAVELGEDGSGSEGGREKVVPVRQGDDWGFPCCATQNVPYGGTTYGDTKMVPDCSGVAPENVSFEIGHTPFGLDFETGKWPAPWTNRVFVTLHGDVGSFVGARVVGVSLDPTTGLPLPASELSSSTSSPENLRDFATGWDDHTQSHGRPAAIAFAPDGRMFIGDDWSGVIFWIAPVDLMP